MRAAFTLLELLVVLVIVALLTSIVAVRLQSPLQSARLESAVQRIAFVDSQTRAHAREAGTACQIVCQLDHGAVYVQADGGRSVRSFEFSLPWPLHIKRVVTPQLDVDSGTARIDISSRGTSPTYALSIVAPQGAPRWILFSGLTGHATYLRDEADVRQIFRLLEESGTDTH